MTTERWNDEMLDRLSSVIEAQSQKLSETQEIVNIIARELAETKDIVNGNARVIQALANTAAEAAEERTRIFQVIEQQQAEIRGLRTESQRILDILLNERQKDEPPES